MRAEDFKHSTAGRVVRAVPGGYWAFVPEPLPPRVTWSSELVNALATAERALGKLDGLSVTMANPRLLMAPFMRREAVLSSRIEGTQASLSDLYAYEAQQAALFGEVPDVREVHNYVRALEYGLERVKALPLSLRLIRELHAELLDGVRGEEQKPGEFRRDQNWIGTPGCLLEEATFVPPPVPEMRRALDSLEKFLHADVALPPLVRLGLIHYQFEAIHPFLDGNGRVGRLLLILLLCEWRLLSAPLLYLSAYFVEHRQSYYDLLLAVSREGAWERWLRFFLDGIATQAGDAVARARALQTLREEYRERLQTARTSARLLQAVDLLFAHPIVRVLQVESALGVSTPTAQSYINRLEDAGILREITGQSRNRVYRADAILTIIEGALPPERGQHPLQTGGSL